MLESKLNCYTHDYTSMACLEFKFAAYFENNIADTVQGISPYEDNKLLVLKNQTTIEMLNITEDFQDEAYYVEKHMDISSLGNCSLMSENKLTVEV